MLDNFEVDNFLKEEIRCDFPVSVKRKKIWKKQLDLIAELDRICKKYNLHYFASNGTLLGAVRHNGFVPWDDDVDIVMMRRDYDKLMQVAQTELPPGYFLHTSDAEGVYFRTYARLRDENTTAMTLRGWDRDCCNGIFVDIFPLDACPMNALAERWQRFWFSFFCALANTHTYYDDFERIRFSRKVLHVLSEAYCKVFGYARLLRTIERIRTRVKLKKTKYVFQNTHGGQFLKFPKAYFKKAEWKQFEHIKLPVPLQYDEILKSHYGDYMELPPKEERGQHHDIFFDPDKPYREYLGTMTRDEAKKQFNNY